MSMKILEKAAVYIQSKINADDFICTIDMNESHVVRFAQNAITQHIQGENPMVYLTVAFGKKHGSTTTNSLEKSSLDKMIKTAENLAKANHDDPEYIATTARQNVPEIKNYCENTASLTIPELVTIVEKCVGNSKKLKATLSGLTKKSLKSTYTFTKNGFVGTDKFSTFSHSMTMKKDTRETKVSASVKDIADFDLSNEINRITNQFESLNSPVALKPGRIAAILRPAAVVQWLQYLLWTMQLRNADEGISPFTNKKGTEFFGKNFTLKSIIDDPQLIAPRFNEQGIPAQNMIFIEKGVLKNMPVSRYYANKKNIQPCFPFNIYMEGGTATETDMMKMVPRGVIINNFWYIRDTDVKKGEMTGLTRDGVLYFENGKIVKSVNNFRWNEVMYDIGKRLRALGPSILQRADARVPTILVDDFTFVDVTRF